MIDKNEILFYILIFLMFYLLSIASIWVITKYNVNTDIAVLCGSALFLIVVWGVRNSSLSKDGFHFEVTKAKRCAGGPYMRSSDPELQKYCNSLSPEELAFYNCPGGGVFSGAPVHYNRTPDTDDQWQNQMCDGNFKDFNDGPKPL